VADGSPKKPDECVNKISIVRADAGTRSLFTQSMSVRSTLGFATKKLKEKREALDTLVKESVETQASKNRSMTSSVGGVVAVGELAASFATILKSKYAFDTVSQTTLAGGVLAAKVYEALASDPCTSVLEPDAILSLATLSCDAEKIDADWAEELKHVWWLCEEVVQDRATVKKAFAEATGRLQKQDSKGRKNQDLEASAKKLEDGAKRLSDLADDAEKSLTALFALDAQGNSLIDAAIRGGILRDILKGTGVFSLTLKTLSSDVDVVARDCLFCTLRVNLASNTVVSWLLVDHKGKVRTTGAIRKDTPMERIQLP
jgi:hypothetical protein